MIKFVVRTVAAVFVMALMGVWLLAPPGSLPARFKHGDCRRVPLADPVTGQPITGAEDFALLPDGDTLILTAYDRRDPARPNGGLYRISLWLLGTGGATQPVALGGPFGSFRPHGVAVSQNGERLALVNRPSEGPVEVLSGPLQADRWIPDDRLSTPALCRANDVAFAPDGALDVSLDRRDCGPSLRDLAPWSVSGRRMIVTRDGLAQRQDGLQFANGLLSDAVAETRGQRIRTDALSIPVPGGPDNLTRSADGRIVAALHPRMFLTWLGLSGWLDRIPSRAVAADPATGRIEVLFDDPHGALFSGATVAVLAGERLVLGSAIDQGILVCGGPR